MLTKRGKKGIYHTRFIDYNGIPVYQSTHTTVKKQAQIFEDKLKNRLYEEQVLNIKPKNNLAKTIKQFLDENAWQSSHSTQIDYASVILDIFHDHIDYVEDIDKDAIGFLKWELSKRTVKKDGIYQMINNASKNRYLEVLQSFLNYSYDHWSIPVQVTYIPKYTEHPKKGVILSDKQFNDFIQALPEYLMVAVIFVDAVGLRKSNTVGLKWDIVDWANEKLLLHGAEMKNGENHNPPLNDVALKILNIQKGKHKTYVFTDADGNPLKEINNDDFKDAAKKAGLPKGFRVQDLRHNFATRHIENGTPIPIVMALGGWKTIEAMYRYIHASNEATNRYKNNNNRDYDFLLDD